MMAIMLPKCHHPHHVPSMNEAPTLSCVIIFVFSFIQDQVNQLLGHFIHFVSINQSPNYPLSFKDDPRKKFLGLSVIWQKNCMSNSQRCKLYESLSCESSAHSFLNELHCSDIGRSAAQELCRIVCREAKTEWEAANTRRCSYIVCQDRHTYKHFYTYATLSSKTDHRSQS